MCSEATKVLLAETWTENIDPTGWWMSEKLDGVRYETRVTKTNIYVFFLYLRSRAYWNGKNFYSRQGNLFHAPDFSKLLFLKYR